MRWVLNSTTEHTGNEGKEVRPIVLIGVSHWHTPFHSDPVLAMKDATIIGVSDPDAERAAPFAAQAKCPVFTDYWEMCAKLKPDFAFAPAGTATWPRRAGS